MYDSINEVTARTVFWKVNLALRNIIDEKKEMMSGNTC